MKVIFDSGAWIAIYNKSDYYHSLATQYYSRIKKKRALFYTNDYILAETYTRILYDINLESAIKFRNQIYSSVEKQQLTLIEIDRSKRELAWQELERFSDQALSFIDATLIANFREYNLGKIFTFDEHFKKCNLPTNPF